MQHIEVLISNSKVLYNEVKGENLLICINTLEDANEFLSNYNKINTLIVDRVKEKSLESLGDILFPLLSITQNVVFLEEIENYYLKNTKCNNLKLIDSLKNVYVLRFQIPMRMNTFLQSLEELRRNYDVKPLFLVNRIFYIDFKNETVTKYQLNAQLKSQSASQLDSQSWPKINTQTLNAKIQRIKLTSKEMEIMQNLLNAENYVMSKQSLLTKVWGYSVEANSVTIESHIANLKSKFAPGFIKFEGGNIVLKIIDLQ